MIVDPATQPLHGNVKLGRARPTAQQRKLARALPIKKYLTQPLPPAPPAVDYTTGAAYGMHDNDKYGNCTIAGLANGFATSAAQEGVPFNVTDGEVDAFYFALSGGRDEGLFEGDVLRHAKAMGFPLDGRLRLAAWVSVGFDDMEMLRSLTSLFWWLYLGFELPKAWQNAAVWDVAPHGSTTGDWEPGSWGGHCVITPKYDTPNGLTVITWGAPKLVTWKGAATYGDEAYVCLDEARAAKAGVDWDALVADMQAVAQ